MRQDSASTKRIWKHSDDGFPFEVVHFGEPANNMATFHWHDYMELCYILENEGCYEIEDKTYSVRQGDILVINNIERHRVTFDPKRPLYEIVLHFDPSLIWFREDPSLDFGFLKLFHYNQVSFNNCPELDEATRSTIGVLFQEIAKEYQEKKKHYPLIIKAKLLSVIGLLLREGRSAEVDERELETKKDRLERLKRILAYIDLHHRDPLGLDAIAERFGLNPSYFSDFFRKNVGITFSEYLSHARVGTAVALLTQSSTRILDIAFESGFASSSSFYAAFKKVTGKSPRAYLDGKP